MNPRFTIEIPNIAQFTAAFEQYPEVSLPILQKALSAAGAVLAKNTTRSTVPWRTGFLTQSFAAQMVGLVLRWYPTASYARYVQFGTAPHMIFPKDRMALFWPGAEHPVRSVRHPGTRGQDYMGAIIKASQEDILGTFEKALEQITQKIAQQSE